MEGRVFKQYFAVKEDFYAFTRTMAYITYDTALKLNTHVLWRKNYNNCKALIEVELNTKSKDINIKKREGRIKK